MASSQNHVPETGVAPQDARHPSKADKLYPMSNWKYDSFLWVMSILADLFFREVHPRGSWKVPRHGPVLFVAAPHNNQVRSPSCNGHRGHGASGSYDMSLTISV